MMENDRVSFKFLLTTLLLICVFSAKAQINIVPKNNGLKEYTVQNAQPYDSIRNVDRHNVVSMPGQTLYMHGARYDRKGYYEVFFTENFLDGGEHPVYKADGKSITPAEEVVGRYYDVKKVWTNAERTKCCMLLREHKSGDEIYYNPYSNPHGMTCVGFYEKLKRYIGQTFLSLAKEVETEDGRVIKPTEGAQYRCVDIGLKLNSDGAFLIMEGADGIRVEAFPIDDEVYEFVGTQRIAMLVKRYGKKYGELIAFRKIDIGMTKEMLIAAWGEPYHKSTSTVKDKSTEWWSFSDNRYVELQNGKVTNCRKHY